MEFLYHRLVLQDANDTNSFMDMQRQLDSHQELCPRHYVLIVFFFGLRRDNIIQQDRQQLQKSWADQGLFLPLHPHWHRRRKGGDINRPKNVVYLPNERYCELDICLLQVYTPHSMDQNAVNSKKLLTTYSIAAV